MDHVSLPALTIQFLEWVSEGNRTYEQAMEAWRSSCPRLTIWEDALADGLVVLTERGAGVRLTEKGRAALNRPTAPQSRNPATQVPG